MRQLCLGLLTSDHNSESVEPPFPPVLIEWRMAFETEEWMLPRLSEEISMKYLCFEASSEYRVLENLYQGNRQQADNVLM